MSDRVDSLIRMVTITAIGPRCPVCGDVSHVLEYGMPAPGTDLTYNRGCVIDPGFDPSFVCSRCDLEWFKMDSGRPIITSVGNHTVAQLRIGGLLLLDDLIAAASSLPRVGQGQDAVLAAQDAGERIGLTADESVLLLRYA